MNMFSYKPKVNDRVEITYSEGTPYTVIKDNNDGTFDIQADNNGLKNNSVKAEHLKKSKLGGSRRKSRKTKRSRKSRKTKKSRRKMTKRRKH